MNGDDCSTLGGIGELMECEGVPGELCVNFTESMTEEPLEKGRESDWDFGDWLGWLPIDIGVNGLMSCSSLICT